MNGVARAFPPLPKGEDGAARVPRFPLEGVNGSGVGSGSYHSFSVGRFHSSPGVGGRGLDWKQLPPRRGVTLGRRGRSLRRAGGGQARGPFFLPSFPPSLSLRAPSLSFLFLPPLSPPPSPHFLVRYAFPSPTVPVFILRLTSPSGEGRAVHWGEGILGLNSPPPRSLPPFPGASGERRPSFPTARHASPRLASPRLASSLCAAASAVWVHVLPAPSEQLPRLRFDALIGTSGGGGVQGGAAPRPPPSLVSPPLQPALSVRKFQKAESDLDYIQHKLEFEVKKSLPDDSSEEENPLTLLKELSMMKSRYKTLCAQLEQVAVEQKESMNCIRATLNNTMKMVQQLEQQANLELSPLTKEEQTAVEQLQSHSTCQTSGGIDLHKTTLM
ncbi:spindle and kinetochore-associated protein 2 [Notamacropus eugenii]|uniref:spindle and kinetochore-associated protein 2 n=1 Tax=Notamacropus eugenii TaxID=9315 RepID=UPI003B66B0D7